MNKKLLVGYIVALFFYLGFLYYTIFPYIENNSDNLIVYILAIVFGFWVVLGIIISLRGEKK